jgi:hypothetical protein
VAYRSAQHAADVWCKANAALSTVGAVDYESDDRHDSHGDPQHADPSGLIAARSQLTDVFEAAQDRTADLNWMLWVEHRLAGQPLRLLSVEVDEDEDRERVAKHRIRQADDVVETVLDDRGLLMQSYLQRAEDHEELSPA